MVLAVRESIDHLRGLVRSFSDETSPRAITLVLGKVGPVLNVVGSELRRPQANGRSPTPVRPQLAASPEVLLWGVLR